MKTNTLLLDNGHGINTKGKCSPIMANGTRLCEWIFNRTLAKRIVVAAERLGLKVVLIVPEDTDISLTERGKRVNDYIKKHPDERCIFYSIHGNAAGNGGWMSARGWEAWTTKGRTNSDTLATLLYEEIGKAMPSVKLRKDLSDGDHDKEANFTVIKLANCPAVLTENFFYDNKIDVAMMQDDATLDKLAEAHAKAAKRFFTI